MTTAAVTGSKGLSSLEELMGRLMDALRWESAPTRVSNFARRIHDARRKRKAGDLDGALALLTSPDTSEPWEAEAHWAYSEWLDIVHRRFGDRESMIYSPSMGRAAALTPNDGGALGVVAVLGMRWQPGKLVSRRSLRGFRPLTGCRSWS